MTVKELQDKLKRCPPDAVVAVDVNPQKQEAVLDVGSLFISESAVPLVDIAQYVTEDDIPF